MSVCPSIGWFVRRTVFYKLLKRQSSYRITCFFNDGAMIELNFRIIEQYFFSMRTFTFLLPFDQMDSLFV